MYTSTFRFEDSKKIFLRGPARTQEFRFTTDDFSAAEDVLGRELPTLFKEVIVDFFLDHKAGVGAYRVLGESQDFTPDTVKAVTGVYISLMSAVTKSN